MSNLETFSLISQDISLRARKHQT